MSVARKWTGFDAAVLIIATLAGFITIYPMWYVIVMSISDPLAASSGAVSFWPIGFCLDGYKTVLKEATFWIATRNSALYVIVGCALMLVTTMLVAFPLTRSNLKGRKLVTIFLLIPMYFSGGMIPSFILITRLGLYNTPWALILPGYSIWNIILCRTYLASLPAELAEAAYIDGANNMQALTRIYLPLSKPVLAVIMIYTVVGIWNSWFNALLYTPNEAIQPVQLYLHSVLIQQTLGTTRMLEGVSQEVMEGWAKQALSARQLKYTMIVVVTLPILLVYPMFQKYFVKGVMLGSLKG